MLLEYCLNKLISTEGMNLPEGTNRPVGLEVWTYRKVCPGRMMVGQIVRDLSR